MPVHRDRLLFQVAYMFTPEADKPAKVDRCTLVTRFGLQLVPWILMNLISWLIFGIIFGVVAQIVWRIGLFLGTGQKLVYSGHVGEDYLWPWLIGRHALCKTCVLGYERKNIRFFDFLDNLDIPRSPIVAFLLVCIALFLLAIVVALSPMMFSGLVWFGASTGSFAYRTIGWWGSELVIGAAGIFCVFMCRKAYDKFSATETGRILISYIKEWKANHCPVYEVI